MSGRASSPRGDVPAWCGVPEGGVIDVSVGDLRREPFSNRMDPSRLVHRSDVVAALSYALDLTEGQAPGHAQRTCLLGMHLAGRVGVSEAERESLFYALLLKDVGCSSSASQTARVFNADDIALRRTAKLVDWTRTSEVVGYVLRESSRGVSPARRVPGVFRTIKNLKREAQGIVETRCDRGAKILGQLDFPRAAAQAVGAVEEYWDGSGRPRGLRGDQIPLGGRLLCLAQSAEIFHRTFGLDGAREMVRRRRLRWFDPELADAFLAISDGDPLWADLAQDDLAPLIAAIEPPGTASPATPETVDRISEAFALVVDAKSPFTAGHSTRVTQYASAVGTRLGLDQAARSDLRRSGLLHDIGKLGVSSAILDKPGALTPSERRAIEVHARHTQEILSRVPLLQELAVAAAAHHERLDGTGYHLGLAGENIPLIARILTVADVFDALTSDRPYREALATDEAFEIMWKDVDTVFERPLLEALVDSPTLPT